jgi:hypothetical protein
MNTSTFDALQEIYQFSEGLENKLLTLADLKLYRRKNLFAQKAFSPVAWLFKARMQGLRDDHKAMTETFHDYGQALAENLEDLNFKMMAFTRYSGETLEEAAQPFRQILIRLLTSMQRMYLPAAVDKSFPDFIVLDKRLARLMATALENLRAEQTSRDNDRRLSVDLASAKDSWRVSDWLYTRRFLEHGKKGTLHEEMAMQLLSARCITAAAKLALRISSHYEAAQ